MKGLKLYEVEVKTTMMVLAESEADAMSIAEYNARDTELVAEYAVEVQHREYALPYGWDDDSLVYQDADDAEDVSIADVMRNLPSRDQLKLDLEKK